MKLSELLVPDTISATYQQRESAVRILVDLQAKPIRPMESSVLGYSLTALDQSDWIT